MNVLKQTHMGYKAIGKLDLPPTLFDYDDIFTKFRITPIHDICDSINTITINTLRERYDK